ncbi:protein TIS11 [Cylas formicarius]|uniref:protein TIS11 n=1 Tax=Cylas formicarius TaxID=197179 RepID=UPI002958C422|nr:protein TIS11 [Cylas formicarius]
MSTAIMSQNAMYEFGDNLIKNETSPAGPHLAVGSAVRLTLTRMASTPCGATTANQNLAALLGNITQQQQQHRRLERTQSAPAPAAPAAAVTATTVNTSRYKTELCRPYEEFGVCKYGDKCQFAHGINELRSLARHPKYKTELCRTFHTIGFCPYGPRCHFVHNQDEAVIVAAQKTTTTTTSARLSHTAHARSRPAALSPSLSLDSPSPPCSLSQSPTSSMSSFFSSEPELHSPGPLDDQRLPVFNRLSTAQLIALNDLMM